MEIPLRADRANRRELRDAGVDRADHQRSVAGVAEQKIALCAADVGAVADEFPFRPDRADLGEGQIAAHYLADEQLAGSHVAVVADQKGGMAVAEEVADPLELPLGPQPADRGETECA